MVDHYSLHFTEIEDQNTFLPRTTRKTLSENAARSREKPGRPGRRKESHRELVVECVCVAAILLHIIWCRRAPFLESPSSF